MTASVRSIFIAHLFRCENSHFALRMAPESAAMRAPFLAMIEAVEMVEIPGDHGKRYRCGQCGLRMFPALGNRRMGTS